MCVCGGGGKESSGIRMSTNICTCTLCAYRPVGSKFHLVRRGSRASNKAWEARSLGGSGGMPPQEKFAF